LPDALSEYYAGTPVWTRFRRIWGGLLTGAGREREWDGCGRLAGLFVFKKIVIDVIVELLKSR